MKKELAIGDICKSIAGRDENEIYIVIRVENGYSYIVDGKKRKLEKPKKKNNKHLEYIAETAEILVNNKDERQKPKNETIRKTLQPYKILK